MKILGFPGGSAGKESACDAGDLGSIPGSGRSPGEGKGFWSHHFMANRWGNNGNGDRQIPSALPPEQGIMEQGQFLGSWEETFTSLATKLAAVRAFRKVFECCEASWDLSSR